MLDIFKKWLDFRGLKFENFENEPNEKLKFKFKDDALHNEWIGFYSVYSNGFKEGVSYAKVKLIAFSDSLN